MTPETDGPLGLLQRDADHRDAEQALRKAGWTDCGAGDWAIALRSPVGAAVARISPFDPAGPYTAALYREAARTRQVPELFVMRAADGRLVAADLLGPDGPKLYAADPDLIVAWIPEAERRFMTEIPLTATGSWEPEVRDAMRAGLAAADARKPSA